MTDLTIRTSQVSVSVARYFFAQLCSHDSLSNSLVFISSGLCSAANFYSVISVWYRRYLRHPNNPAEMWLQGVHPFEVLSFSFLSAASITLRVRRSHKTTCSKFAPVPYDSPLSPQFLFLSSKTELYPKRSVTLHY